MARTFTKAHLRALDFLPADCSWVLSPVRDISPALDSLRLYHRDLVDEEWGAFGPRRGPRRRFRLTTIGAAEKTRLIKLSFKNIGEHSVSA